MDAAIVNLGLGNLGSVQAALWRHHAQSTITFDPKVIAQAPRLLLPGVGSFDAAMDRLRASGLDELLRQRALGDGVPLLGICLGMQLLLERSDEGHLPGLAWISGRLDRFQPQAGRPVPHMGWNTVTPSPSSRLFTGMRADARYYFVHSFRATGVPDGDVAGSTWYGDNFASAVEKGSVAGVQFHPEKSHQDGAQIFRNFLEWRR
ncbi:imidazole glycerol phosphate synthase subunit HisH [Magnetospirillum moscoviense]|uniref:Imidazole glycerol phosphate synthase subunit HisH n=1 Tax=Magnetospirillum moscoviense TaxID=1437059 RepID=A0A178MYZ9_9PROT|nr:imidazole glycerol phosphate synthase subunit HisH [Magnetospirillum moscoviense]OAN55084.1 hypothetical protein A6A05_00555 [Magnetospirillum moscoviense]